MLSRYVLLFARPAVGIAEGGHLLLVALVCRIGGQSLRFAFGNVAVRLYNVNILLSVWAACWRPHHPDIDKDKATGGNANSGARVLGFSLFL